MRSPAASLRSVLSGLFFAAYGLAALPFAVLLLLPIWRPAAVRAVIRTFYRGFVWLARLSRLYRVDLDATTRAAIAACRGRVVVANHVSLIDVCILLAFLPDATAVAKAATLRNPFLAMVVRRMFVVNGGDAVRTLAETRALLDAGVNVLVFPQGTRGGRTLLRGAARIALAAGARIAAFQLAYSPVVLAKRQPWWDVGDREIMIQLHFRGELAADGGSTHAAAVRLTEEIGELIR